jgi:hypothetical protein
MNQVNAVITKTMLGFEDHGIMTFWLHLSWSGSGQGCGGYCIDGTKKGIGVIMEILKVVGVDKWEDLKGNHIRARQSLEKVHAIGNILEDKWLDFGEYFNGGEE